MSRYLIVANQTLGGEKLDRTIRDRAGRGDSEFFVVVPMTASEHESDWTGGSCPTRACQVTRLVRGLSRTRNGARPWSTLPATWPSNDWA